VLGKGQTQGPKVPKFFFFKINSNILTFYITSIIFYYYSNKKITTNQNFSLFHTKHFYFFFFFLSFFLFFFFFFFFFKSIKSTTNLQYQPTPFVKPESHTRLHIYIYGKHLSCTATEYNTSIGQCLILLQLNIVHPLFSTLYI
jgi:hypothetical protein